MNRFICWDSSAIWACVFGGYPCSGRFKGKSKGRIFHISLQINSNLSLFSCYPPDPQWPAARSTPIVQVLRMHLVVARVAIHVGCIKLESRVMLQMCLRSIRQVVAGILDASHGHKAPGLAAPGWRHRPVAERRCVFVVEATEGAEVRLPGIPRLLSIV